MSDLDDEFRRDIVSQLLTEPSYRAKLISTIGVVSTKIFDESIRCRSLTTDK